MVPADAPGQQYHPAHSPPPTNVESPEPLVPPHPAGSLQGENGRQSPLQANPRRYEKLRQSPQSRQSPSGIPVPAQPGLVPQILRPAAGGSSPVLRAPATTPRQHPYRGHPASLSHRTKRSRPEHALPAPPADFSARTRRTETHRTPQALTIQEWQRRLPSESPSYPRDPLQPDALDTHPKFSPCHRRWNRTPYSLQLLAGTLSPQFRNHCLRVPETHQARRQPYREIRPPPPQPPVSTQPTGA